MTEQPPHAQPVARFLSQFRDALVYVLIAAAATTAALDQWVDTAAINEPIVSMPAWYWAVLMPLALTVVPIVELENRLLER